MEDSEWHPAYPKSQRPMSMPADYDAAAEGSASLKPVKSSSSRLYAQPRHPKAGTSMPRPLARSIQPTSSSTMPIPIPANPNVIPGNLLPSAPASPPTPAPSPTPGQRAPNWSTANAHEDIGLVDDDDLESDDDAGSAGTFRGTRASARGGVGLGYRHMRGMFAEMSNEERKRMLAELLNMCDGKLLGWVNGFVAPMLKRDPFGVLPNELCLRILTFIDDAKTLARSSQVSHRWHELVSDDMAWKSLCEKHAYRRMSDDSPTTSHKQPQHSYLDPEHPRFQPPSSWRGLSTALPGAAASAPDLTRSRSLDRITSPSSLSSRSRRRPQAMTYRSHFKQRYQVETAWRIGGKVDQRQITPDQGVVTSLHLTDKYIIVALDNAKIHIFDTEGRHLRCLQGHVMGVWAMVPWGDTLVSGGCDRDVRVWDMATGKAIHMLRGHTSTVRCLKMSDRTTAISGSRDTTLRVWDIEKGICKHVLVGHQASVRCLEIHGDLVVSGSYDTTARIWSISEGRCLRTLQGHFSQIYAVAFDGKRVATGSLDTSVRVWNVSDGKCLAILQGHTSLVGQLQLRHSTLVTGGSDGSVRVWSLDTFTPIHRLAAHDNSVTSLQFDDSRIVSGGSDGRVKVWDLARGVLVRELGQPAEAVWRVVFEEEKAVVLASRGGKTVMEVWSFAPPIEDEETGISPAVARRYSGIDGRVGSLTAATDGSRGGAASPSFSDLPFSEPATSPLPMAGSMDKQLGGFAGAGPSGLRSELRRAGLDGQSHYYDDVARDEPTASTLTTTETEDGGLDLPRQHQQQQGDVVMSDEQPPTRSASHDEDMEMLVRSSSVAFGGDDDEDEGRRGDGEGDPMSTVNSPGFAVPEDVEESIRMFQEGHR